MGLSPRLMDGLLRRGSFLKFGVKHPSSDLSLLCQAVLSVRPSGRRCFGLNSHQVFVISFLCSLIEQILIQPLLVPKLGIPH